MKFQAICNVLAIQTNTAWLKEVEEPTLSKEFMTKHRLKGSPKLSKQLIKLGMHPDYVSTLLSNKTKGVTLPFKFWENNESPEIIVRLQGNSIHFDSCQAIDNYNNPNCWEGSQYCQVERDLIPYLRGDLMFITTGNPITLDDKGWRSRAKVRLIVNRHTQEKAWYLDRTYGNSEEIVTAAMYMAAERNVALYTKALGDETTNLTEWSMPSRGYGYADNPNWQTSSILLQQSTLLKSVYKHRTKEAGTYKYPLSNVQMNPQNDSLWSYKFTVDRDLVRVEKKHPLFLKAISCAGLCWHTLQEAGYAYADTVVQTEMQSLGGDLQIGCYTGCVKSEYYSEDFTVYNDDGSLLYTVTEFSVTVASDNIAWGFAASVALDGFWKVKTSPIYECWNSYTQRYDYSYESDFEPVYDEDEIEEEEYVEVEDTEIRQNVETIRTVLIDEPDYGFAVAVKIPKRRNRNVRRGC